MRRKKLEKQCISPGKVGGGGGKTFQGTRNNLNRIHLRCTGKKTFCIQRSSILQARRKKIGIFTGHQCCCLKASTAPPCWSSAVSLFSYWSTNKSAFFLSASRPKYAVVRDRVFPMRLLSRKLGVTQNALSPPPSLPRVGDLATSRPRRANGPLHSTLRSALLPRFACKPPLQSIPFHAPNKLIS